MRRLRAPRRRAVNTKTPDAKTARVLVVGLSRSGSTWQFNALRELLRRKTGAEPATAHADGDSEAFDACLSTPPCLLKTHGFVPRLLSRVDLIFTSHRDLRDVLLSSMQMFGSCLGFGPDALHSRDARSSAAAHDVAPRFQQYAQWKPHFRRADLPQTSRGDAAAAGTWIFRGDESRRRRGWDVDIPWGRVTPRLGRRRTSVKAGARHRYAAYDMRYEIMYADREAEVQRLATALGLETDKADAAAVVQAVEAAAAAAREAAAIEAAAEARRNATANASRLERWDSTSGFSANHVHESTSRPGAGRRAETLVQVALQLPSCPIAEAFTWVDKGFGRWQAARGYGGSAENNAFVDSLPAAAALEEGTKRARDDTPVFPRLAHIVHAGGDGAAALVARDAGLAEAVDAIAVDARGRPREDAPAFDYACRPASSAAAAAACAVETGADYVVLATCAVAQGFHARLRARLADERRPLARAWALAAPEAVASRRRGGAPRSRPRDRLAAPAADARPVDAVVFPARWAPALVASAGAVDDLATIASVLAHFGDVLYETSDALKPKPPPHAPLLSPASSRLRAAATATAALAAASGTPAFARCCCELSGEPDAAGWLWNAEPPALMLQRCGLASLSLFGAARRGEPADAARLLERWCDDAARAVVAARNTSTIRRPGRAAKAISRADACAVDATNCARARSSKGAPAGGRAKTPPRRILVVRDAPVVSVEGADARTLRRLAYRNQSLKSHRKRSSTNSR